MGMADQYDDGRYDPEPDCLIAAGGWHAPLDTVPGWPFGPRGGTLHHHRKESTTMPKSQNEIALEKTRDLLNLLQREERELQDKVRAERRPAAPRIVPSSMGESFAVDVRFRPGGRIYRFLLLQTNRGWYTTGTDKNSYFKNWSALLDWLEGPTVHWHSPMLGLVRVGSSIALPARGDD